MHMTKQQRAKLIPLRRWVPEVFDDSQPLAVLPQDAEPWEPLTDREAFKFWVPVMCFCAVAGLVVGLIVGSLKA